jgi:hypothetical protein
VSGSADAVFLVCRPSRGDGLPVEASRHVMVDGVRDHRSSSKRLPPRRPSITMRRSAVVHLTVPEICGWDCERPEAVPDGRFEGVAEFVATCPPLDVHKLTAVEPVQHDSVDLTAPAGAAGELLRSLAVVNSSPTSAPAGRLSPSLREGETRLREVKISSSVVARRRHAPRSRAPTELTL